MFQFSIGVSVNYGQSSSTDDLLKGLTKKLEQMELNHDEKFQKLQKIIEEQKTEISGLNTEISELRTALDGVQNYKQKYSAMKRENQHLRWEKATMERGIEGTCFIPRKWVQHNIREYRRRHHYQGYQPTESDSEDEL